MTTKSILVITALLGALSVALGAFAAHGLKKIVEPYYLEIFDKAVRYQFYHTFAIGLCGLILLNKNELNLQTSVWLFLSGIVFFSGSLYLMTFTQMKWLGAITPIGGLCFIAGWLLMAWQIFKSAI
jgi:uncharacterized membrane protein YgdD (TMEM256/DUF423 family)